MRFTSGWVKSYRSLDDGKHWIGKNAISYAIFHRLIAWANYQETKVLRRGTFIKVPRGALITSSHEIAVSLELERKTVERYLALLENDGTIVQQISHRGRIITICNYERFQSNENKDNEEMSNCLDNRLPTAWTTDSPLTGDVLKNPKKEKNQRTKELSTLAPLGSDWLKIGHDWLNFALTEMPWQAKQKNWTAEAFGRELERVGKAMTISASGFYEILSRVRTDEFWRKNAASPFGLLKKSDKNGMRKIDNILVRLKTKQDREKEALAKFANSDYKPEEFPF